MHALISPPRARLRAHPRLVFSWQGPPCGPTRRRRTCTRTWSGCATRSVSRACAARSHCRVGCLEATPGGGPPHPRWRYRLHRSLHAFASQLSAHATRPFAPSSSTTRLRAASGFGARRWREKAAVAAGLTLGADPAMDATPERQDAIRCRLAHHAEMQAAVAAATAAAAAGAPADHVIVITGRCAPTARTQCRPLPRTSAAPSSSSRRATRSQVFG